MSAAAPSRPISSALRGSQRPIRGELFSIERLEEYAERLASEHTLAPPSRKSRPLTPRVVENGRVLLECYRSLAKAVQQEYAITPAAEWLVDNFHIVDEQVREVRDHLPQGFYRKLPKLASGELEGFPRVFAVAWAFVEHTDSRLDTEVLRRFMDAYQRVQPLTIGELWALTITLRVVLVENLRRIAQTLIRSRAARQEADELADRLIGAHGQPPVKPERALTEIGRAPLAEAFAVQLLQRLRDLSPNVRPVLLWLDQRLAKQGTTADEIVRSEHRQQAAMNVTVRNIITSMRLISSLDWHDFFESISLVDRILRDHSNFAQLTFATRDSYRHAIEELSSHSPHSETEIARAVVTRIEAARGEHANEAGPNEVRADPGYYLVSRGRLQFEREVGYQPPLSRKLLRLYVRHGVLGYLGTIALLTAAIVVFYPVLRDADAGVSAGWLVLLGILALVPASDLAISLINRFVTDLLQPRALPRLELKKGVPEQFRTLVVIPTLLAKVSDVQELVGRLEVHYLANQNGCLHYALLSDWLDAPQETLPSDGPLLAEAVEGISRLNRLYGPAPGGGLRFLLFHRKRVWNPSEGKWMGWERKRGKLHELNQFLRGSEKTTFIRLGASVFDRVEGVRYVLTLDSDTRLPRGSAQQLIGTIAHPLNRAVFSERAGRVVEGYGVVQPRVTASLPTENQGTWFQRIFSGPSGVDPYPSAISDVYQDLFHEGSYTGKGLYDIDAFEHALAGKVPENSLLSHDLFEGTFARTALVTDAEFFEEYPAQYALSASRQHRWARGDWQLLPWIFGRGPRGHRARLPIVGRWKMLDNLRRSLSAPAAFLALLAGWLIPASPPGIWSRFILAVIAIPALLPFFMGLNPRAGISKRSYLRGLLADLSTGALQTLLLVTFLSYQAWLMADAIVRTVFRLAVVRKRLLEWITAAQAKHMVDLRLSSVYLRMAGGVSLGVAAAVAVLAIRPSAFAAAGPFIGLWLAAPAIARWISLPPATPKTEVLSAGEREYLRLVARRTWRFFETFVTDEDHFLPPDNFQEDPKPTVAHRTSPTNIGLSLLTTLAAHDFGWIGIAETVERIEKAFDTMERLEKFRGHLYNWYDTGSLQPLDPRYISSVDSGNLAGHLIAVANGLRDLEKSTVARNLDDGLTDNLELLRAALANVPETRPTHIATRKQIVSAADALADILHRQAHDAPDLVARISAMRSRARSLADIVQTFAREREDLPNTELQRCADAILHCVESHYRDAELLIPLSALDATPRAADPAATAAGYRPPRLQLVDQKSTRRLTSVRRRLPCLANSAEIFEQALEELREPGTDAPAVLAEPEEISTTLQVQRAAESAAALADRLTKLVQLTEKMIREMDFTFLFDRSRKLFSIGYRPKEGILDLSCYDLLASEARLTSFVAIAKGDVEASHWFRLGRSFTPIGRGSALISWSGSMFEYLMPALVMRSPAGSVLHLTNQLVVRRQIEYGVQRHVPWGISESAFNARDLDLTYQYSGFGIPGLGLKRGLSEDLVIAPYATALAAMVAPSEAATNFQVIARDGGTGPYGFYEALDFTKTRVPEGKDVAVVHTYMAHHQGMSLLSLSNVLLHDIVQNRFHAEPIIQATELLLQERTPRDVLVAHPRAEEVKAAAHVREVFPTIERRFTTPHEPSSRTQLLSNGKYALMLTSAGSGYSRVGDIAVTRWREDATRDAWGSYIYLRDTQSNKVWSAGYQPSLVEPDSYEATFYEDRAEFKRRDGSIVTAVEAVVSSEDDAEMRRVTITNYGSHERTIQVTSYAEVCLTTQAADLAHPAFSNLFVETEFDRRFEALLATRRRQSDQQQPAWLTHLAVVDGEEIGPVQYETDRAKFIGRGRSLRAPASMMDATVLSNSAGPVLDPVMSLRRTIRIPANKSARVVFTTGVTSSREQALALADKYRDPNIFERILTLAWTQAQVQLHHLSIQPDEANLFQRMANVILYSDPSLRPAPAVLSRAFIDVRQLWGHGISGDLPIVLALIDQTEDVEVVRQLVRAHEYWRLKQIAVDLVIINEEPSSYEQELHSSLASLVRGSQLRDSGAGGRRGDVFLLRADLIQPQARRILESVARAVLVGRRGSLADQLDRAQRTEKAIRLRIARPPHATRASEPRPLQPGELEFFNGLGGFANNGREYVIAINEGLRTPQPWINVIANPNFGFLASESGSGYTWSINSREHQLTPWSNDSVTDPPGEAIYIRDEADGSLWTPTPLPVRDESGSYIVRHGQGYTRFEHVSRGIRCDLLQYVPLSDPIKISRLRLRNDSSRARRLSVTAYAEWVLGNLRSATAPYLISEVDSETGALFARNAHSGEFAGHIAFADLAGRQQSITADRKEFVGRHRSVDCPAALDRGAPLSGKTGAALDPCAALQTSVELRPGAEIEIVFFLGDAPSEAEARRLLGQYRSADLDAILSEVTSYWENLLGGVQVSTPDRSMDILLNRWLLYQTISCRVWGRAAFYQVSGAYGFRDQLQDVLALCVPKRDIAREHLLRAAGRQFGEGDVQHWWHPPSGRGTRTRISDDRLWLPYAVSHFIERTTDMSLLDERVSFLEGEPVPQGQADAYFEPRASQQMATVFEHCARAIDSSLAVGAHGLPLMGTGDWNDGMNRVGEKGKGESIWLGWFLHRVLGRFAQIASDRGEHERAQEWRLHMAALQAALEREAWDGEWYLRAYYDDGSPLGSSRNAECQIDSIAQSWAVISRVGEPGRVRLAMDSVRRNLVRRDDALVLLFTPPFGQTLPADSDLAPAAQQRIQNASRSTPAESAELAHVAVASAGTTAQAAAGSRSTEREPRAAAMEGTGGNGQHAANASGNGRAAAGPQSGTHVPSTAVEETSAGAQNPSAHDPGYIKGYIPGIRENGGQYTHAAVWNVLAYSMLGDGDRAVELFGMLNPINHSSSRAAVQCYKVEPYVLAGDVYSEHPHVGRGGWTWYTGSAGWLYRVGIESILGFQMHGLMLHIDPCIPRDWPRFSITFRYHSAVYEIRVENPSCVSHGVALTRIDGVLHAGMPDIRLADDHQRHDILIVLG
ncbi:MAG TPA: glucoamylase family protein [Candidatus Acidoferrales bacterium]|nr:glucoamylase family protein [Candidatus Acidoferrales bacterium]